MEKDIFLSKEDLSKELNFYMKNKEKYTCEIMFVKKTQSKAKRYIGYMLECGNEKIANNTVEQSLKSVLKYIEKSLETTRYDLDLANDDKIQVIEKENVINSNAILNLITDILNEENTMTDKVNFSSLDFIVIKLCSPEESIDDLYLFKKCMHFSAKFRDAMKYTLNGKVLKTYDEEILTIGTNVETILYKNFFYIFNRNSFNSMFDYRDLFYKVIDENTEQIVKLELFEEAKEFINDCRNDGRYNGRLAKAILLGCFNKEQFEKDRVKKLKSLFSEKIEVDLSENGKIMYSGKSDINCILNIMLKHYVIDPVSQEKMIAKAIERYNC